MATKKQREPLPSNILYRVISQPHGDVTPSGRQSLRVIGYTENYTDAEHMARRYVLSVSKVQAIIETYETKIRTWFPTMIVKIEVTDSGTVIRTEPLKLKNV